MPDILYPSISPTLLHKQSKWLILVPMTTLFPKACCREDLTATG
jgi:hypothetical protein